MSSSSTTVNFSTETVSFISVELELDDDYHISLYNTDKTEFYRTENVYLKIKPTYDVESYSITVSNGNCSKVSSNNIEIVEEFLSFENTQSVSISNEPIGTITTEWTAGDGGGVLISGKQISINSPAVAILKATYEVYFDRLKLTTNTLMEDTEILVVVGSETYGYESLSVDYVYPDSGGAGGGGEDGEPDYGTANVIITVKDVYTANVIQYAHITVSKGINQIFSGGADINGQVVIPSLEIGETYDITTTANDYINSGSDYLNNDSFTVTVSES